MYNENLLVINLMAYFTSYDWIIHIELPLKTLIFLLPAFLQS